jgi:hypothetical protein
MTFLGLLLVIAVLGSWVYSAMRLAPVYLNYMKVAGTLEKVRDEYNANPSTTDFMIRKAIERHFDIEMVNEEVFNYPDVQIRQQGGVFTVRAAYEQTAPLVANVSFLVTFDKSVDIQAR